MLLYETRSDILTAGWTKPSFYKMKYLGYLSNAKALHKRTISTSNAYQVGNRFDVPRPDLDPVLLSAASRSSSMSRTKGVESTPLTCSALS